MPMLWHIQIEPAPGQADRAGRAARRRGRELGPRRALDDPGQPRFPDRRRHCPRTELDRAAATSSSTPSSRPRTIRPARGSGRDGPERGRARPAQAGRHRPRGRERAGAPARPRLSPSRTSARSAPTGSTGPPRRLPRLIQRVLANDAVEQAVVGPLAVRPPRPGAALRFRRIEVPIRGARRRRARCDLSRSGQLSLSLAEMRAIQRPLRGARPRPDRLRARDPRPDLERALLAQDPARAGSSSRAGSIDNLLKQTIFGATQRAGLRLAGERLQRQRRRRPVRRRARRLLQGRDAQPPLGHRPLRRRRTPGLGGVIRDALGTGLGAKPICNTDVFCVAPPDLAPEHAAGRRPSSQARAQGGRRRRARLRQPHGHPHGQRRPGRRSRLPGQPAGLLRDGGRPAARAWRRSASSRATGSSRSAAGPAATASTGRPSARPS